LLIESDEERIRVNGISNESEEIFIAPEEIVINSDGRAIGADDDFIAFDRKLTLFVSNIHRA
jgi:hypothetical protein